MRSLQKHNKDDFRCIQPQAALAALPQCKREDGSQRAFGQGRSGSCQAIS